MNTKELASLFSKMAELLSLFQDKEVDTILDEIIAMVKKSQYKAIECKDDIEKPSELADATTKKINALVHNINSLPIKAIEEELNNTDIFISNKDIREFAETIGLTIGTRQNRSSIIHTIIKHIERSRINKTISERNE